MVYLTFYAAGVLNGGFQNNVEALYEGAPSKAPCFGPRIAFFWGQAVCFGRQGGVLLRSQGQHPCECTLLPSAGSRAAPCGSLGDSRTACCAAGQPIRLIKEPDNPADPMAIKIEVRARAQYIRLAAVAPCYWVFIFGGWGGGGEVICTYFMLGAAHHLLLHYSLA